MNQNNANFFVADGYPPKAHLLRDLQGGMIAMMADKAGQSAAREATGNRLTTVDLILHYLSPGRAGPFTTDAQVLRSNRDSALSRVGVKDAGDDHRIIAVAMNTAALDVEATA